MKEKINCPLFKMVSMSFLKYTCPSFFEIPLLIINDNPESFCAIPDY
jgi:hypothetical protein